MKDVTTARFSLFAAGINKPSSQRPYKKVPWRMYIVG